MTREDKEPRLRDVAVSKWLPGPGEHMESISSLCLMKSMFVFRRQHILIGSVPTGILQAHMEVICSDSSAEKEIRGGGASGS